MIRVLISMLAASSVACAVFSAPSRSQSQTPMSQVATPDGRKSLVVAGGCFWCLEVLFEELKGVQFVESCYAGGSRAGVSYQEVCSGTTGHAEAIRVVFDPKVIAADDLLRIFFTIHDPTTLNRQGPDSGTQYRSAIFYADEEEKARAERIRKEIADEKIWQNPLVTTVEPLVNYTRAEEYHQDYYARYEKASPEERAKMNAGYCSAIIQPKVLKFRQKFAHLLKKSG